MAIEPEPPQAFEFGEALWVKVFKTESPEPADLDHLVTDDPAVPQEEGETEVDWVLLQSSTEAADQLESEAQIGADNESVTRRYEFYQYTGPYDPETHEALPQDDSSPLPSEVGNYVGAQMAAINIEPRGPEPSPTPTPILCGGDCSGNGAVTVDEIVMGVNVALGRLSLGECPAFDISGDGAVTVDELIEAVTHALLGC